MRAAATYRAARRNSARRTQRLGLWRQWSRKQDRSGAHTTTRLVHPRKSLFVAIDRAA